MVRYSWPGNVRELKNVIERAMILAEGDDITPKELPFELREVGEPDRRVAVLGLPDRDDMSFERIERLHLSTVLARLDWNKSKASRALGISRATLRAKIRKYNIAH
jgi:transcriptional regulator of acetoin/glycerol metabolism